MQVPFLDLQTPHRELWPVVREEFERAFNSAGFVGGPHIAAFESEFAKYCSAAHCAAVSNGTDALRLALQAAGIQPGDEVITSPHTFIATTEAISQVGAKPVFADIDPVTYTLDPAKAEAAVTPKTRVLMPVHLYGQCADMDPLLDLAKRKNLILVEDAAQAHGAEYKGRRAGSMGRVAGFSFYPGKNLGAAGEAGAVTSQDADVIGKVRVFRDHGQASKYYHDVEGSNARMDSLQAIVLREKLKLLEGWNEARRKCARYYDKHLAGHENIELPHEAPDRRHVYHLYVVLIPERDRVQQELQAKGIGTGLHYPLPLHIQKAYAHLGRKKGDFPITERTAERLLSLPMFPTLTEEQQAYVCECLISAIPKK